ncbi:transporter [Cryobacterium arcticum]|uniref:Transporter n=1 Tax=Cryobacterium arcticum TaxID=670052 RepID=A0A317ZQJ7_9MICO|nr:transporter [Cryobacterium arcticum]
MPRIPLNTLASSFGVTGLAALWSAMTATLDLSAMIPAVLWTVAGVTWGWLIAAHLVRGSRSPDTLLSQLRQPAQGPIAAIVPTVGMLLGAELYLIWPAGGFVLALIAFLVALMFAGWILAFWHTGHLNPEAFHGGYLLPTVASPLVASAVAARLGFPLVAEGAFAVGIFFWAVLVTVLLSRLAFFPPLPDPLTPTFAILLAPPGVAGAAWFAMNGAHEDFVSVSLLGLLALMAVLQLFLIRIYRRLPFSLGWWSFTFPAASAAAYAIEWAAMSAFLGWEVVAFVVATAVTALIGAIAIRSVLLISSVQRGFRRAEQTLRRADDAAQRPARPDAVHQAGPSRSGKS